MASQEFYLIEGKLRRTVYAIVKMSLIEYMTTLDDKQISYLAKKVKGSITDATNDAVEYLFDAGLLEVPRPKKSRKR